MKKISLLFLFLSLILLGSSLTLGYADEYTITYSETELTDEVDKIEFTVTESEGGLSKGGSAVNSTKPVEGVCLYMDVLMTIDSDKYQFGATTPPTNEYGKTYITIPCRGPAMYCDHFYSFQYFLNTIKPGGYQTTGCCQITIPCLKLTYCIDSCEQFCTNLNTLLKILGGNAQWKNGYNCNYCNGLCQPPTYVEISQFDAFPLNRDIMVTWTTGAEIDNFGFNIYRAESDDSEYSKINDTMIIAEGSPTQGASYEFIDKDVKNRKTYYYKLEDIDIYGTSTFHGPVSATPRQVRNTE